jgi:integrase
MDSATTPYLVLENRERKAYPAPLWHSPIEPASSRTTKEDVSMYDASKFQKLTFAQAAPVFLTYKRTRVKAQTIVCYEMYLRHLMVAFGQKHLYEITIEDIREYQKLRAEGKIQPVAEPRETKRGRAPTYRAGPALINHEINTLSQVLDKAGQWDRLREWYSPVQQEDPDPPKTLTMEEEQEFFVKAARNPDWELAYWVGSLTNNTSASGVEIRNLRLMDVDLQSNPPKFRVPEGKNKTRKFRPIALNETACKQMGRMVQRAITLGACRGEHFVFPFRVKRNEWDVTRPASKSWIKKQWKALTIAAGKPWLKPHNLRFQCATKLVAAGVQPHTIKKQFGWRNLKMLEHYDRPQLDILYEAVQRIDPGAKKPVESSQLTPQWMPKTGFPQKSAGGR